MARLEPLPFAAGAKPQREKFLRLLFANWLSPFLRNNIAHGPRSSHASPLGNFEAFAQKPAPKATLAFVVGDDSGDYELSELAARHWIRTGIRAIAAQRKDFPIWVKAFGYEYRDVPAEACAPLVEVKVAKKAHLVGATAKGIIADGPHSLADLDAASKKTIARVARASVCECSLCRALQKKKKKKKKKKKR